MVAFGQPQMLALRLMSRDGLFTNLGLLLSDQCPFSLKVAVFEGKDQGVFKDRREFTGSLLEQLNDVYDYIDLQNRTRATFEKLLRIDARDYPGGLGKRSMIWKASRPCHKEKMRVSAKNSCFILERIQ